MLALTIEAFAVEEQPEETAGVGVPAALAFLGLSFFACALIISGLPPLPGFLAKFTMFHALLNPNVSGAMVTPLTWTLVALIVLSGFTAILALMRFGVRTFWVSTAMKPPRLQASEVIPIGFLLALSIALAVMAGPAFGFLGRAADDLQQPANYINRVLSEPVMPGVNEASDNPVEEGAR